MAANLTSDQILQRIDAAQMSVVQVRAVAMTILLSALDGYDVLSVTFAAPAISQDWGIGKAALGVVLSSGLAGMALGSFLLAPLADLFGRRRLILVSLMLMGMGMLASAFAHSAPELGAWRVVTGLGIGACVAVINPIAAEFANARQRPLVMAMMAMGFPAGGLLGGLLAAYLLQSFAWSAVFLAGAIASLLLIPLVLVFLPEPIGFLLTQQRPGSLSNINGLLSRFGQPEIAGLPAPVATTHTGYRAVFRQGQFGRVMALSLVNLLFASAAYFALSWMPQLINDTGFSPSTASLASALANLAGIAGGLLLGIVARTFGLATVTASSMIALGATMTVFGFATPSLPGLLTIVAMMGFSLFAAVAGYYGILATQFPAETRATACGFVIGTGRISSALGPVITGALFAAGLGRGEVALGFGTCAIAAATILLLMHHPREPA